MFSKIIKTFFLSLFLIPAAVFASGNFVIGHETASFVDASSGSVTLNLQNTANGLTVTDTAVTGYAWGDVAGWINFGPLQNGGVDVTCDASTATLSGYAWGQNAGWINFGPFNNNSADQVTIDGSGNLTGYAWSQNFGWLDFAGTQTTFVCATQGGGGGGNNNDPACSLNSSPGQIATPGSPVTLSWELYGANPSFSLLGSTYTNDGSVVVYPTHTTTYTATVTNDFGTNDCDETVIVSAQPETLGCTDSSAINFNTLATVDNGRCVYFGDADQTWDLEYVPTLDAPVTSDQCSYFKTYLNRGSRGPEVAKVQYFLNEYMGSKLKIDGVYGPATVAAVHTFQRRHFDEIIRPWHPPLALKTTGRWYKTTMGTANIIVGCPEDKVFLEDRGIFYSFVDTTAKLLSNFFKR